MLQTKIIHNVNLELVLMFDYGAWKEKAAKKIDG